MSACVCVCCDTLHSDVCKRVPPMLCACVWHPPSMLKSSTHPSTHPVGCPDPVVHVSCHISVRSHVLCCVLCSGLATSQCVCSACVVPCLSVGCDHTAECPYNQPSYTPLSLLQSTTTHPGAPAHGRYRILMAGDCNVYCLWVLTGYSKILVD
jgi:hypothetical protein